MGVIGNDGGDLEGESEVEGDGDEYGEREG